MPPRKKKPPPRSDLPPSGVLDWTHGHWAGIDLPCRYCDKPTPLRDGKGKPAHKVCAEQALAEQAAEYAAAYNPERFLK